MRAMKDTGCPMNDTNPRIELYREAITLEVQRANLQSQLGAIRVEIDALNSRLVTIKQSLFTAAALQEPKEPKAPKGPKPPRAGRGELKAQVLTALVAAGDRGLKVKEIANTLGVKPANIYSFFQTVHLKFPQIKKIGDAQYRLEGEIPAEDLVVPVRKSAPQGKRRGGKRNYSTRPLSPRGALASRIVAALQESGEAGMKVRDIAEKLNVKVKNLFIWFATTGKKNANIKKVGESLYRLEA